MSESTLRAYGEDANANGNVERLMQSRQLSLELAQPLSDEDQVVQAMDDASPTKWHLGHTTWFYETFILKAYVPGYRVFDEAFDYCFNSYYNAVGERHPRPLRGLLTRPSAQLVRAYRRHVDEALVELLSRAPSGDEEHLSELIDIGINHEQQHQELMLTDILALFAANPLRPAYSQYCGAALAPANVADTEWTRIEAGMYRIGAAGAGFHFDCEGSQHEVLLRPFKIANRLVTNAQWLEFMADGGYQEPSHWLSDGWAHISSQGWVAPGYWQRVGDHWHQMTLRGLIPVDLKAPVSHVSYFEADAFARWSGKRLPLESEWEVAAQGIEVTGNLLGSGELRPVPAKGRDGRSIEQLYGDVWEWTQSPFSPYPGYRPVPGALGEYNGKFMNGQYVLRGASCVTVDGHSRSTYRNFFYPHQRWQFMGLRLAQDA